MISGPFLDLVKQKGPDPDLCRKNRTYLATLETRCMFLGSVTGDCCLFSVSLYSDNFSLVSYFRAERGLKRNLLLVYDVQEGDIFHI